MLEKVKVALRKVKVDAFDGEILDIIAACRLDMILAGISKEKADLNDDPLITRAIILYAKAQFGYIENADGFQKSYDALKNSLTLAGDYNGRSDQTD